MTTHFRLYCAENISRAAAFVFVVPSRFPPRLDRRGGTNIGMERDRLLVQAEHRLMRVVRLFIRLQYVFHLGDIVVIQIGHHPHFAESARGIAPRAAHRTVRKPLDLHGSCNRKKAAAFRLA